VVDQEDYYGPLKIYETLEKTDTDRKNYIVIGPWNHGGWAGKGPALGPVEFGDDQSLYYRQKDRGAMVRVLVEGQRNDESARGDDV